jgi:Dna[CI] antecedent, DciA
VRSYLRVVFLILLKQLAGTSTDVLFNFIESAIYYFSMDRMRRLISNSKFSLSRAVNAAMSIEEIQALLENITGLTKQEVRAISIKEGVLTIQVSSQSIGFSLNLKKNAILQECTQKFGAQKISRLRFLPLTNNSSTINL